LTKVALYASISVEGFFIMEHPLIDTDEINKLTVDEIGSKISELNKKLTWALRYNASVANQIRMALDSYQTIYQKKQDEIWNKSNPDGNNYQDRIDIT